MNAKSKTLSKKNVWPFAAKLEQCLSSSVLFNLKWLKNIQFTEKLYTFFNSPHH